MDEFVIKENIISSVFGTGIPKPANDQNTDDITPARFLKEITFANMGKYAYLDERVKEGKEIPTHPFNDKRFKNGSILVAGANYGCGSSREHAPQALHRFGIRAIIAESFAEIFAGNCASLGIVGVTVPAEEITKLVEFIRKTPSEKIVVSLADKKVKYGGREVSFEILEGRRQAFLNGTWDALTILQQNAQGIAKVKASLPYLGFK
ncbi:Isopropylmalate/citramalate isomerase small subunit [uncultured archaeon]|nr:Isopropylmalate/citramalate isomerase small subunit [uncultured archaeon]